MQLYFLIPLECKIKALAGLNSSEASLSGLLVAFFSLSSDGLSSGHSYTNCSSYKDIRNTELETTLKISF